MDIAFIKKLRQSIASLTVLALLTSFVGAGTAFADWPFTDAMPSDSEMADSLMEAYEEGWLQGYGDTGASGWDDSLQRDAAAKIAVVAFLGEDEVITATEDPFVDVTMEGSWSVDYVTTAQELGIVQGYTDASGNLTGYYGPADKLNNAQWAVILQRATLLSADTSYSASDFVDTTATSWWLEGYQMVAGTGNERVLTAAPGDEITRGEVAVWTNYAQDPVEETEEEETTEEEEETEEVSTSDAVLTVEVSADSPESMNIPSKSTSVEVAAWDFTAEGDDAMIEALEVHQYGLSDMASDAEVYLYMGNERLTTAKTVNSSTDLATFNNVDVEVEEGETVTLTVRLNAGNVGSTARLAAFELASVSAVETNGAEVAGDFPVQASEHDIVTTTVGTLTVEKTGSITNPTVGESGAKIGQFKMTPGTNPAAIQEIGLYIAGSVDADELENFELYVSGEDEPVATAESADADDVVRFVIEDTYPADADTTLPGVYKEESEAVTFYLYADYNTGRTGDTTKVYIDELADVVAVDTKRGFGMEVDTATSGTYDGTTCTGGSSDTCSYSTLEGGEVTMSRENISTRTAVIDQNDVSLFNGTIVAESDVTFRNFGITLNASGTASEDDGAIDTAGDANFTDIRVRATDGSFTWGPVDSDSFNTSAFTGTVADGTDDGSDLFYLFTDDLEMEAGDSMDFQILVDIENNSALADTTVTAGVYIDSSYPEMRDALNTTVTNADSLVPTSTMTGDSFTIEASSLSVARDSSVNDDTVVIGAQDAEIVSFILEAGAAEGVTVTDITLTGSVYDTVATAFDAGAADAGTFDGTSFSEIVLSLDIYEESVAEENKINATSASANSSTGLIEFNNIDWELAANESKAIIVTGDFNNNSSYNGAKVRVDIADVAAHVEAIDEDGSTITSNSADYPNGADATSSALGEGAEITISSGGTLSVDIPTQVSLVPASQIVVAGTDDNLFTTLRFTSTDESFQIDKLAIRNEGAGSYDADLEKITLQYYTDEEQTVSAETTCNSSATSGVYTCTGLDIMVPDPDITGAPNYANVRVYADVAGTSDITAGDQPALTLSLAADFNAYGVDSSTRVQQDSITITDLSETSTAAVTATGTTASATATALTLSADSSSEILAGDFLVLDASETVYVSALDSAGTTATVVRGVNGTTAGTHTTVAVTVYGTADETLDVMTTNFMQVQKADLSMEADSTSVTGKSTTASDTIMTINTTVTGDEDVSLRQGKTYATATDGTDTSGNFAGAATTAVSVDGSSYRVTWSGAGEAASTVQYAASNLQSYSYVSFWLRLDDNTGSDAFDPTTLKVFTSTDATVASGQATTIGSTYMASAPLNGDWVFVSDVPMPTGTDSSDDVLGFEFDGTDIAAGGAVASGDFLQFDQVRVYNDKVNVDLSSNEAWKSETPTIAYLKQDGTTVATGYFDADGVTTSETGQITFVPVGTYGEIQISGSSEFTVVMDTATNMTDDPSNTESLTATIDMGYVSGSGDVFWYDQASSLNFFGVNSDDRVQVTNSY